MVHAEKLLRSGNTFIVNSHILEKGRIAVDLRYRTPPTDEDRAEANAALDEVMESIGWGKESGPDPL